MELENVRDWQTNGRPFEIENQKSFKDFFGASSVLRFSRYLQALHSSKTIARYATQLPEKNCAVPNDTKGPSQETNISPLHQLKGLEMPEFMNTPRGAASSFRFLQSASSAKTTQSSHWFLMAAAKYVLSQSCFRTTLSPAAIGLLQSSDNADRLPGRSKNAEARAKVALRRRPLTSLCTALFIAMSCAVAGAQTTTATTLSVTPSSAANQSVFTMTATVKAGTTSPTGGTVTFSDTYSDTHNSITHVLGTVQVQSANGTAGNAVLLKQLGGIG